MTVVYVFTIASANVISVMKLLWTWKGSLYKTILIELIAYIMLHTMTSLIFRFVLNDIQKLHFQTFSDYCSSNIGSIPVAFVLNFYVNLVVRRWSEQRIVLPWPDGLALFVNTFIIGRGDVARKIRRNILRYANVSQILCYSSISSKGKRMFPSIESLVKQGLLTNEELEKLNKINIRYNKHFVPILWAHNLVTQARRLNLIRENRQAFTIVNELNDFRDRLRLLFAYDWINPPLIYTQIAIIIMYSYFIFALFGVQFNSEENSMKMQGIHLYVPLFGALEFINYMGLLKVAQCLINPFGDDDDDFDIDEIIIRNLEYSFIAVDQWHNQYPQLYKDIYYNEIHARLFDSENKFIAGSIAKQKNF